MPTADGDERPLWEAGRSYGALSRAASSAWRVVPSFFAGSLLGGGLFGGWGWDDEASAGEGDGGDGDGGDGGDFGDFGDFGGGDFGGGDFGGGGGTSDADPG